MKTPKKKIYIAGPMRGIKHYNFPAFDSAKNFLEVVANWKAISPADIDRESGFDPVRLPEDHDWDSWPESLDEMNVIIERDLAAVLGCDAIYMLEGWQDSTGAKAELAVAQWAQKRVMYDVEQEEAEQEDILEEALRITGGDRQNSYGPPDQDFKRTAVMWEQILNSRIEDGALILEPYDVAMCMIALKLSRQTHQSKRDNWVDIAGYARCGQLCAEVSGRDDDVIWKQ